MKYVHDNNPVVSIDDYIKYTDLDTIREIITNRYKPDRTLINYCGYVNNYLNILFIKWQTKVFGIIANVVKNEFDKIDFSLSKLKKIDFGNLIYDKETLRDLTIF